MSDCIRRRRRRLPISVMHERIRSGSEGGREAEWRRCRTPRFEFTEGERLAELVKKGKEIPRFHHTPQID